MKQYFNVNIEFDRSRVDRIIDEVVERNGKGYVCSVEGNILAQANTNPDYLKIVNGALVNICDGSSIAGIASIIHRKKLKTYIGADLFIKYIKKAKYRSYFLGNSLDVLENLKVKLAKHDPSIHNMKFVSLPFRNVEEFDYQSIADLINEDKPDVIWVSLGAPKQENFMNKLLPYIDKGVMFGFGAILNFYSGTNKEKRAPKLILKLKLEWVYRLLFYPEKQWPRIKLILKTYPRIIYQEISKK